MKNLSRLTALLLALVMLLSITASATEISNLTKADYDDLVAAQSETVETPSLTATDSGFNFAVSGEVPADAQLYVTYMGEDTTANIYSNILGLPEMDENMFAYAFDISIYQNNEEWQPGTPVEVTVTGVETTADSEVQVYHIPDSAQPAVAMRSLTEEDLTPVMLFEEVEAIPGEGTVTFMADGFSIYVVVGSYSNDWNYNNYRIVMTEGDSLQVSTSTSSNNYSYTWSIIDGDSEAFSMSNTSSRTATIKANAVGTITIQCRIRRNNTNIATETMVVESLASIGNSVDDDIIFYNIDKEYTAGDTEYENTYGPYVMKIRFEDTEGNVLKYEDGTTVGDEFYVFDSVASIDKYAFSADAPDGYTYSGAFFYWSGHFEGDKVYVTSVDRDNDSTAYGSHLYFSGTHNTSGEGRWSYQPSGILHVVYAPMEEVYTVIFKDHCGYDLANYALQHNDSGVRFPTGYVANITTMAEDMIPAHHNDHDVGTEFNGTWVVTGGGDGENYIAGTYTTEELKRRIVNWQIEGNITITAQCSEPDVTINYVAIPTSGAYGKIDLNTQNTPTVSESETVKVVNGNAVGAKAIPSENYILEGWYTDEACTTPVNPDWLNEDGTVIIPQRIDNDNNPDTVGRYEAATYYAKFVLGAADLTITKTGLNEYAYGGGTSEDQESAIFKVEAVDKNGDPQTFWISLTDGQSVTIKDLQINSTATITEQNDWTWRYADVNPVSVQIKKSGNVYTFRNVGNNGYWLGGDNYKVNIFGTN